MKIILVFAIVIVFGLIGYLYKYRLEQEYNFLKYIDDFNNYYYSNMILFKNNAVEIINNYIIMHKNKNANFNDLFLNSYNIYSFSDEIISKYVITDETVNVIKSYLFNIGKNEYEYEREKSKNFSSYLKFKIDESYNNFKNKGNLYFKILLAIGAVIGILIW